MKQGRLARHKNPFRTLLLAVAVAAALVSGIALASLARAEAPSLSAERPPAP